MPDRSSLLAAIRQVTHAVQREKLQYIVFFSLSLIVTALTGIISKISSFERYFGDINPLIIIVFISILGITLLSYLLQKGEFKIYEKASAAGFLSAGLAAPLAIGIILVDLKVVFPNDLNIPYPQSLLFYPAIGFVVEILFHVLPLSVLFFSLTGLFNKMSGKTIIWISIFVVSLLEPIYQTISYVGQYPLWTVVYVGLHVFLINLVQLVVFRRYDFIRMYAFRFVYYLLWHVLWGYMRLRILF